MDKIYKYIGNQIRRFREDKGISQLELAKVMGYKSKVTMSLIESGNYRISIERLKRLADYFGVNVGDFVDEEAVKIKGKDLKDMLKKDPSFSNANIAKILEYIRFVKGEKKEG